MWGLGLFSHNEKNWKIFFGNVNIFRELYYRKFLGWTSWKSRFSTAYILDKKHLFIQKKIKRPRENKHALSMWEKESNNNNFPNAICIRAAESVRAYECSRINHRMMLSNLVFYYSEQFRQFIADITPYFLRAVQFSFGLLCRALLVLLISLLSDA